MQISSQVLFVCRLSLIFMWLFTAATSFWWARDMGYEVLALKHLQGFTADFLIDAGSALDAFIGLWLMTRFKLHWCYVLQIFIIVSYSLLLSWIAPDFWLHPFGPLVKNIPILALLYLLAKTRVHPDAK